MYRSDSPREASPGEVQFGVAIPHAAAVENVFSVRDGHRVVLPILTSEPLPELAGCDARAIPGQR